jgi:2-deoxy-D-gluconate 3-dehydrogenase
MSTNPFDLSGKLAVVTGARRGIGYAMAIALARAGSDIIGVSANMESKDSSLEIEINSLGRAFWGFKCNFENRDEVIAFADLIENRDIDILINNAGSIERSPALEHPPAAWDRILEINLSNQFILTQRVAKGMLERARGKIIFTASMLSFQGGVNVPSYTASKSAISGLVKALSNEWASKGVLVNAIAPGYIATDNTQALQDDPTRSKSIVDRIPSGRWGRAEDIGGTAVFLASDASNYVTGITLPVDGGWLGR